MWKEVILDDGSTKKLKVCDNCKVTKCEHQFCSKQCREAYALHIKRVETLSRMGYEIQY